MMIRFSRSCEGSSWKESGPASTIFFMGSFLLVTWSRLISSRPFKSAVFNPETCTLAPFNFVPTISTARARSGSKKK